MIRSLPFAAIALGSAFLAPALAPRTAAAQTSPQSEGVPLGGFTFRPSVELRLRGEFRRYPVDTGGDIYSSNAVLAEGFGGALPPLLDTGNVVRTQWFLAQRARLGLAVERGPITGVVTLQDARLWGNDDAIFVGAGEPALPDTAPYEAYVDLHTRSGRRAFVRLGRQRIEWGDGRLIGADDETLTARSLDGVRAGVQLGNVDLEAMAVLLAAPGGAPPEVAGTRKPISAGTGTQLYGLNAIWHVAPLLHLEATALARIAREPRPSWITPGDTVVLDARVSGDRRGFRYAVEGAYEVGRVATFADDRPLGAFAAAARAELETSLPAHLTFSARGAYATGDDGALEVGATQRRFDPILPDAQDNHGPMGLYAWSNVLEAGGGVRASPFEAMTIAAGYAFVGLASPRGRWVTARLLPVGAAEDNESRTLGHEIDASLSFQPWEPLRFAVGYGLFLFGEGAQAIFLKANRANEEGRPADLQHWAFLQATLRAP
ncbi:alginate export family protein [Sorangium sp. So ce1151]|uniref:alginate export family protein n=1 Tax=Sorangium sp. So ce1151 TaxID=3133332 RepID=UPI003F626AAC